MILSILSNSEIVLSTLIEKKCQLGWGVCKYVCIYLLLLSSIQKAKNLHWGGA